MSKLLDAARGAAENMHNVAFRKAGVLAHVLNDLRDAIAEEEAKHEDGTHSCGYFCKRPACVLAQRDELRAKLDELEAGGECDGAAPLKGGERLYTHPAPAYVAMTDEELHEVAKEAFHTTGKINRAIEQAVLARLGVSND